MSESKPRATIDQAKAAWESHPAPTVRDVVKALEAAGYACSVATLQRWKAGGWALKTKSKNTDATEAVAEGVARQDNKVLTRQEKFEAFEKSLDDLCVDLLKDEVKPELAEKAVQERHVAAILLAKAVQKRAAFIVEVHSPEKVAKLLEALQHSGTIKTEIPVAPPGELARNGDDAKVIDGRVLPAPSATTLAIEAFKNRQRHERHGVAA